MEIIRINDCIIGEGSPAFVIAEVGQSHDGSLGLAHSYIDAIADTGADAVKFQHHIPEEEMLPDVPMSDNFELPLFEFLKKYALTLDQHQALINYCKEINIQYLCTPFSYKAAEELIEIDIGGKLYRAKVTSTRFL